MKKEREFSFGNLSWYLGILYTSGSLFIFGLAGCREGGLFLFLLFLGSLGFCVTAVYWAMILYRLWKFVIRESSKSGLKPSVGSPKTAVGRLFIPGYNFYWIFICFRGLSRGLTALASQRRISARLSTGFATTICVFCLLGCIPFVNFIAAPIATFILLPVYVFKIATFARNIRVYAETGKDLFVAHGVTCRKMASARTFVDIFPKAPPKYPVVIRIIVLALILEVYVHFFAFVLTCWGFRVAFMISVMLAGLLVNVSQSFKSTLLIIGSWTVASGIVGIGGSFMLASYYGDSWILHMGLWRGSLFYGAFFMALLFLMIRIAGVRWWGIFLAYIASFILYSLTGEFLFRIPEFWRPGVFYVLLGLGLMTAALYSAFYFHMRLIVEDGLLKEKNFAF